MTSQHTTPFTIADAERLAEQDAGGLEVAARNGQMAAMTLPDDYSLCLVDGSAYSPSWRAMSGGAQVYAAANEAAGGIGFELCQAYEETLDAIVDDWSGRHEETLGWENGCLFLFGPSFDWEQLA